MPKEEHGKTPSHFEDSSELRLLRTQDAPSTSFPGSGSEEGAQRMYTQRNQGPKCHTCFDLDQRYIPQPDRDEETWSYREADRPWISSSDLQKDRSCASCRFLKSAFDTLLNSGDIINIPLGSEIV